MTLPLTAKQEKLWKFIGSCERSPSLAEMTEAMGLRSTGSLAIAVRKLEERGYVRRTPGRHRSTVVVEGKPDLDAYTDADLIAELECRTQAALRRAPPIKRPEPKPRTPRTFDWRDDARRASESLLAAIQTAGLRP